MHRRVIRNRVHRVTVKLDDDAALRIGHEMDVRRRVGLRTIRIPRCSTNQAAIATGSDTFNAMCSTFRTGIRAL